MSCGRYREMVSRYVDDALTPREQTELMAHIQGCAACAAKLAGYRQASLLLGRLPESEPSPRVRAAVLAEAGRPAGGARVRRWVVAAAVVAAAVAGSLLWRQPETVSPVGPPTPDAGPTAAVAAQEAEVSPDGQAVSAALQTVVGGTSLAFLPRYLPWGTSVEQLTVARPPAGGSVYEVDLAFRTGDGRLLRLRQNASAARPLSPPTEARRVMIDGREWRYVYQPAAAPGEPASYVLVGEVNGAHVELESSLPLEDLVKVARSLR